jgi:hypothetical protein
MDIGMGKRCGPGDVDRGQRMRWRSPWPARDIQSVSLQGRLHLGVGWQRWPTDNAQSSLRQPLLNMTGAHL